MGWGPWGRKKADQAPEPDPVTLIVLRQLAERLDARSGSPWRVQGDRVHGPGRTAIMVTHEHEGTEGHVDLLVVLDTDRPEATSIPDCVSGFGATREEKLTRAVEMWVSTSGAALLEMLEQRGWHGSRFAPQDPTGFPGWHAVQGGVVGWGVGPEHERAMRWAADQDLLPLVAPALRAEGLPRDELVGVKLFFGSLKGNERAEVRVNGQECPAASAALLAADWPRPAEGGSYARTYAILVHPA
ncbi:hypothetical protein ABH931_007331 [Streptacidiphilus sp. MAP12-33]|uniref:DUF6348 family protein n=1 Tax=Streptacidiphilus sp. MAP12-33 TaxID=3156266 RepID=UPI0035128B6C